MNIYWVNRVFVDQTLDFARYHLPLQNDYELNEYPVISICVE